MTPWDLAYISTENNYIDFKKQWYSSKIGKLDLVHDILSMANSVSNSPDRFIFIGIYENPVTGEKTFHDISNDNNRKTTEQIVQILRDKISVPPIIELISETIENKCIDCIKITPIARDLPYVLNSNLECDEKITHPSGETKTKKHILVKNAIYSRDSSRNNGSHEYAAKEIVYELFARKNGENLPILERFKLYLDDVENWKKVSIGSQNTYYYTKNHKFKIVCNTDYDFNDVVKTKQVLDYSYLLDFCICEDYWTYNQKGGPTYDDRFYWLKTELWADNTPIELFDIASVYLKYYIMDVCRTTVYLNDFYLPNYSDLVNMLYDRRGVQNDILKQTVFNSIQFKICRMMQNCDSISAQPQNYGIYLDFINYQDLTDTNYRTTRKDFIFEKNIWAGKP